MRHAWILCVVGIVCLGDLSKLSAAPPLVEKYLHDGKLAEGEKALLDELGRNPKDDEARFGLGALQFVRSVERLGQSLYRFGLRSELGQNLPIPFLRLPIPTNPKPQTITYDDARLTLKHFIDDLTKAEATLAMVRDEQVKLPLRIGLIRLDLKGNGEAGERFIALANRIMGRPANAAGDEDILVVFDRGDVAWMRGYCHLLMALAEIGLAYDGQELFDCTAHLFFAKPKTPHKFLGALKQGSGIWDVGGMDIVDVIALVHLLRMPIKEKARMKTALTHLEKMLALGKESWRYILAETDDDHEWIPNPRQKGALNIRVTQEMVDRWLEFIDESEALLAGKRLVPLWRGVEKRGINLRRVFTEPRALDVVLWVQGTAATPYLEEGELTKPAVWSGLIRVFQGDFFGFAVWFN